MPSVFRSARVPWAALLVLAGLGARAIELRGRAASLTTLPDAPSEPPAGAEGWCAVVAPGVALPAGTFAAAVVHAQNEGLRAVDLVPADLSGADALDLLAEVEPAAYRDPQTVAGRTAGHAMVIREDLAERAGISGRHTVMPDPVAFLRLAQRLKECAVTEVDLAVTPGLGAVDRDPGWRAARLRTLGIPERAGLAFPLAVVAAVAVLLARRPRAGVAALLALWLRPLLVLGGGTPLRPYDLNAGGLALRPVRQARNWARAVAGRKRRSESEPPEPDLDALRDAYAREVADGLDRFFEPRRDDCPWCGSPSLVVQVKVGDLYQGKPGKFTLERCLGCGHVFQNPRLSPAGLDYYYRDFYDGIAAFGTNKSLVPMLPGVRGRAEIVRRSVERPKAWLDVGSGPGHFCAHARGLFPETVFDGLDMSSAVLEGERNGWLGTAYQGQFPDLADGLAGRYDVISMHHYLEHTTDPRAELAAAARALGPGGHLLIEVPDPQSGLRHLFRSRWVCWLQPQHLNFLPPGNLRQALAEHGFTVVADEHGPAHTGGEFIGALAMAVTSIAPDPDLPWATIPRTLARRIWHKAVSAAATPFFVVALLLEMGLGWLARRTDTSDAYRVLARRNGDA